MQEEVKDMITREEQWRRKIEEWRQNYDMKQDKIIEIMNRQIGEISCKLSSDQRSKDVLCHGPNSRSTYYVRKGTRTIPVLLHVEIPSNWDQAQINEGLEKTKMALDLLSGNIRIRYFSTEQLKMLLDVLNCEDGITYEVYRLLEQLIQTSNIDMSIHSNLSASLHFVAEEDIPSIPDNSIMASVNVNLEQQEHEGHYIQQQSTTASLINEKTAQFAISTSTI